MAGFCCGCVPVTLCPPLSWTITSIPMLCLIIFIDDISCYKNICQNYCLSCPNNSDYNSPSINYRQLHSQLFPLSLPSISCINSTDRVLSTEKLVLGVLLVGYFFGGRGGGGMVFLLVSVITCAIAFLFFKLLF